MLVIVDNRLVIVDNRLVIVDNRLVLVDNNKDDFSCTYIFGNQTQRHIKTKRNDQAKNP